MVQGWEGEGEGGSGLRRTSHRGRRKQKGSNSQGRRASEGVRAPGRTSQPGTEMLAAGSRGLNFFFFFLMDPEQLEQ